ncbi:hypothetical protein Daus18300_007289 [Diaporthe australafricana]|uniref:BTB domain-containing protein n=1 Tax=Diaporthe australafricana TaxID=127596 RepID=A0ABR3WNR2_9PEZI
MPPKDSSPLTAVVKGARGRDKLQATPTPASIKNDQASRPTDSSPSDEFLSDRIVTIIVGHQKKRWSVHENLLSNKSEFFRASFRGGFRESKDGVLELPEDDPRVFELFVGWAYAQPINDLNTSRMRILSRPDDRKITIRDYIGLHAFGEKYMMERLQNEVANAIYDYYQSSPNKEPLSKDVEFVYNNTLAESKMRELMTFFSTFGLLSGFGGARHSRHWGNVLKGNGEIGHDLVMMLGECHLTLGEGVKNLPIRNPCSFHVHKKTPACVFKKVGRGAKASPFA